MCNRATTAQSATIKATKEGKEEERGVPLAARVSVEEDVRLDVCPSGSLRGYEDS